MAGFRVYYDWFAGTLSNLIAAGIMEAEDDGLTVNWKPKTKAKKEESSSDDSDSEDGQISSESEDEIIEDMEQVEAEMKKYVELNKTVEDKESNQ